LTNLSPEQRAAAYAAWLYASVDLIIKGFQRKQGQANVEGIPRLQRVLRNVLTAVGMAVDDSGKHLPLIDALVLLNIYHSRHQDVFQRVAPLLESDILADFERWPVMKSLDQFPPDDFSIVRLRAFLQQEHHSGPTSPLKACKRANHAEFQDSQTHLPERSHRHVGVQTFHSSFRGYCHGPAFGRPRAGRG